MANALGNDVASFQGDINYDTFKNNSQFVIMKASEGTSFKDPKFSRNQSEARRVGLAIGYYHFARTDLVGNTPEIEAQWFLNTIGQLKDGEILVLDWECANQKQADIDWCKKWLDYVKAKTGVAPLIYLNQSQHKFNWKSVVDAGYGLWIAAYTGSPTDNKYNKGLWPFAAMQQWTNQQKVPGISGNVDGNVFFGDLATFKKYGYKTPPAPPTPTPTPTPPSGISDDEKRALDQVKEVKDRDGYGNMESAARGMNDASQKIKHVQADLDTANIQLNIANAKILKARQDLA